MNENDGLEDIPDIEGNRDAFDILDWDLKPDDAVAFDYRTLHWSPANNSPTSQRRAFSLRMVGDGTRFARRENIKTSPPFNGLTLKHGYPLKGGEFYLITTKQKNKNRHALNRDGSKQASAVSKKSAKKLVNIYKTRMQIEEGFRDMRSTKYDLDLSII